MHNRKPKFIRCALLLMLITAVPLASAGVVTVSFSGSVYVSNVPNVPIGAPLTGQFTYFTPGSPVSTSGGYLLSAAGQGLFAQVASYTFSASADSDPFATVIPARAGINGGVGIFGIAVNGARPGLTTTYPGYQLEALRAQVVGNANFLKSTDLPIPFNTSDVLYGPALGIPSVITVRLQNGVSTQEFDAYIFSLAQNSSAVPEPGTMMLTGLTMPILLWVGVRRNK